MKLPPRESLLNEEELFLYEHDRREYHNPLVADFQRSMYSARFESTLQAITKWASGKRVLDVGCAQGNISLELGERGYSVVALDLRAAFLRFLGRKYERGD